MWTCKFVLFTLFDVHAHKTNNTTVPVMWCAKMQSKYKLLTMVHSLLYLKQQKNRTVRNWVWNRMLPCLFMRFLMGLVWLFAAFLWLLVTLVMTTFCTGLSNAFTMMQTFQDLLLRSSFITGFRLQSTWLITFLIFTTLVTLVLLGLATGFTTTMWLGWLAALRICLLARILDAATLQKVLLHLLARWHNELKAFSTRETAPIMADHYMVEECAVVLHYVCTERTTGYFSLLPQLSLIQSEYQYVQQSQSQVQFLQET